MYRLYGKRAEQAMLATRYQKQVACNPGMILYGRNGHDLTRVVAVPGGSSNLEVALVAVVSVLITQAGTRCPAGDWVRAGVATRRSPGERWR